MGKKKRRKRNKVRYEDEFDGMTEDTELVEVDDPRIPSPAEVAKMLKKSKITIMLDDQVIAYFKTEGKKHHIAYQKLIRELLKHYVNKKRRAA